MFNMGLGEMIFFGAIALIIIGPKQLPEVARVVGRMLNEFKRATGDITSSLSGIKNEADSFRSQAESYMHKQKADFEQKVKEAGGVGNSQNEEDNPTDSSDEDIAKMREEDETTKNNGDHS